MNEFVAGMLTVVLFLFVGDFIDMVKRDINKRKNQKRLEKFITEFNEIYLGPTSDKIEIGSTKFGK